jgi:polysaccharide export outer membrane protein
MKIQIRILVALAMATLSSIAWSQDGEAPYQIRHGDKLQISVWREESLSREVRVLPDGSISFPLVGRLMVAGNTTDQVEKRITEGLKTYIPEANVTASVTATEGSSVFVLGKVLKAGQIPLTSPSTTVLQVLSQVGGLDRFANGDAILVMRREANGKMQTQRVRYNDLMRGDALETNVILRAGDTVLVP